MGFSLQIPSVGQPNSTEQPKEASNFTTLQNWGNGQIDPSDVKAAFAQSAGMNQSGQTVKGSSVISTSQSTGSTTFTTLATPDQVSGIVLPTPGLIAVWYQATWQESVANAGHAGLFLGASQVNIGINNGSSVQVSSIIGGVANTDTPLSTWGGGFTSVTSSGTPYVGDVSTGQIIGAEQQTGTAFTQGGPCYIFAAAGTYTVSVQFKASSGTVTAKNRRLYVQALSFA